MKIFMYRFGPLIGVCKYSPLQNDIILIKFSHFHIFNLHLNIYVDEKIIFKSVNFNYAFYYRV